MAKRKQTSRPSEKLFADDQRDLFEKSYEEQLKENRNRPVECLGMTFENDEKRREYFMEKLREKLKDPGFRKIEGFPIGEDEDKVCKWDALQILSLQEIREVIDETACQEHPDWTHPVYCITL